MRRPGDDDPHAGQRIIATGRPLEDARAAMILVHGRGAGAAGIIGVAQELAHPDVCYLAPEAAGLTWYPYSFLAPLEQNEPWLGSALRLLADVVQRVSDAGIPPERTVLLGFSQGACLTLEFTARNPGRRGGVVAFTGGLIGPEGTPRDYPGDLDGTPVFIGTSDPDPHIPVARVEESARVLQAMGAEVTTRVYPGMGHTVNQDELAHARVILEKIVTREP